jgi:hypothetical protein
VEKALKLLDLSNKELVALAETRAERVAERVRQATGEEERGEEEQKDHDDTNHLL